MANDRPVSRRAFVRRAGQLLFALGASHVLPPPAFPRTEATSPTMDNGMIIREAEPQNFETPVDRLTEWITPNDLFYVRTHNDTPQIDLREWRLHVGGAVAQPLTLTLADLQRFPVTSEVVTLECAGNGRAFYQPAAEGVQWEKGAVGTARWTGVRLRDVLQRAGVTEEGRHIVFNGADVERKSRITSAAFRSTKPWTRPPS
jgi:DMSO/TMAO reductase YedYZ molybdopterin-dependent catalytic subunit